MATLRSMRGRETDYAPGRSWLGMRRWYAPLCALLLAASVLAEDFTSSRPIAPGVTYSSAHRSRGPWEVRVLRVSRDEALANLHVGLGRGGVRGLEALSGIVKREDLEENYVVAGTNGDFFVMAGASAGVVTGPAVRAGELVTTGGGGACFLMTEEGVPRIGELAIVGELRTPHGEVSIAGVNRELLADSLCLYTAAWGWPQARGCVVTRVKDLPLRTEGEWRAQVTEIIAPGVGREAAADEVLIAADGAAAEALGGPQAGTALPVGDEVIIRLRARGLTGPVGLAVGGGPVLMRHGQIVPAQEATAPRHPRTAVGYSDREFVLVTVDGRQPSWSVGMTLHTLAGLMQELGCTDALNLDGGGSSTMWVRGAVVNRPSDGRERLIANALLLRSRAPHGPLARLTVRPEAVTALPGAAVPLQLWLTDEWFNPVEADPAALRAEVVGAAGGMAATYADGRLSIGPTPGEATVRLSHPECATGVAEIGLRVIEQVARVEVTPALAHLCLGESVALSVRGIAGDGTNVWLPEDAVSWQVQGDGLEAVGQGTYKATRPGARATVAAQIGEVRGGADIKVASQLDLEGFETDAQVRATKYPDTEAVSSELEIVANGAAEGGRYCRLTYDLGKPEGTRAAYVRLDREIGTALKISLLARAAGSPPWLRAAVVDGNGTRHLMTLVSKLEAADEWRRVEARLPDGMKPPLVWQSVYIVATAGQTSRGALDVDALSVARVTE